MYIRNKIKLYSRFNVEGALKMLKKGDVISYGTTGVCKVEGECEQTVKGHKKRYSSKACPPNQFHLVCAGR